MSRGDAGGRAVAFTFDAGADAHQGLAPWVIAGLRQAVYGFGTVAEIVG